MMKVGIFGKEVSEMLNLKRETVKHPEEYPQEEVPSIAEEKLVNKEICTHCGGRCCLNAPCHFSPSDFEDLSYSGLKRVIKEKGYISIVKIDMFDYDYYKEFSDQFYHYVLRIKRHGDPVAFKMEKNNKNPFVCMLLTKKGCKLKFEERPKGARMLVPRESRKCLQLYNLEECMRDWKDYTKTLRALYKYFKRRRLIEKIKVMFLM